MLILLIFAFISGLVTILAPCIWPLLPIVLSSSATGGKRKPVGITLGIILSFAIFTLSISYLVSIFHFDPDILRLFAVIIIGFLGLSLVIPALSAQLEAKISKISGKIGMKLKIGKKDGFWGGFITGLALGIVWSPCAGPILTTIATLATTQSVTFSLILVTLVYVTGVGIPLFLFSLFGSKVLTKSKVLSPYTSKIQQVFGIIMVITAIAIYTNYDKVLQVKLLDAFPSYTKYLTQLESNPLISSQLSKLRGSKFVPMPTSGVLNPVDNVKKEIGTSNLPNLGRAPEFVGISHWLNSDALKIGDLKGKVVLVDFWTYTCINCIRTLPHVVGWYEKYKDKGFVVVGVHTSEFEFEKKTQNVINAIKQYQIHYPVAQDNDFKTWQAYENQYWPAKYLIDTKGNIRFTHFGEGEYDTTEMNIKLLLEEAGNQLDQAVLDMPDETPQTRLTPETYLGSARMERFGSALQSFGGYKTYDIPAKLDEDNFAYGGRWDVQGEMAVAKLGSLLELNFNADKVFLVMTPKTNGEKVKVYLDGKVVSISNSGKDVMNGEITLNVARLYNLIDLKGKSGNHKLRIEFETEGISVYAFTFG